MPETTHHAPPPDALRHVAYNPSLGVFLGARDGIRMWSKLVTPGEESARLQAPTFLCREHFHEFLRSCGEDPASPDFATAEMRVIFPSKGDRATANDAADAALPRWGR